jgi:hypothetical protein
VRIVFQGDLSPKQLGEAIKEIIENTLGKVDAEGKRKMLHNPVFETNLNIKGVEAPQLLIEDEKETMLTIHTGIENGELTEYVEVDRSELLEKFNRVTDNMIEKADEEFVKNQTV